MDMSAFLLNNLVSNLCDDIFCLLLFVQQIECEPKQTTIDNGVKKKKQKNWLKYLYEK